MSADVIQLHKDVNEVWTPLAGSQAYAICCPCNHILYEGSRGPGKTDAQLMFFRSKVGLGYGQFWRGIIFDREYKNLDDLITKSKRWFHQVYAPGNKPRFLSSGKDLKWIWPSGEELWFRTMKTEQDYWNYHGQEFPFIGWNELTKHPTPDLYESMMSCNRSSFLPLEHSPVSSDGVMRVLPELPLVVFSTSNPYGAGHNWVKQKFIDVAGPGKIVKIKKEVYNPRTKEREEIVKTQVRLFGSYKENRYLSPEYVLELESITDQNKREAWLYGNWNITAGGMFDDVWANDHNVVENFEIPNHWRVFRSFDWGSSKPFSVGWWAESDGTPIVFPDRTTMRTVRGDIFRINEWYGWTGKPNTGTRMLATKIAQGIVERELKMGLHHRMEPGPADNSINDVVNGNCIATEMANDVTVNGRRMRGITWSASIKSPGSRKNGWEKVRVAIYNAHPSETGGPRESPGLFVFRNCQDGFIRTVPTIPRSTKDLDDVDTDAEDHVADETRYVILSHGSRFDSGSVNHF